MNAPLDPLGQLATARPDPDPDPDRRDRVLKRAFNESIPGPSFSELRSQRWPAWASRSLMRPRDMMAAGALAIVMLAGMVWLHPQGGGRALITDADAQVIAHTESTAENGGKNMVLHQRMTVGHPGNAGRGPQTRSEAWTGWPAGILHSHHETFDGHGNVVSEFQLSSDGDGVYSVDVDHTNRTWSTVKWTGSGAQPEPSGTPSQVIRDLVRKGDLKVVGRETVDGHRTIHLRGSATSRSVGTDDVWVDADTYLFVRTLIQLPMVFTDSHFDWLPSTAENLSKTTLTIPSGYRQVEAHMSPSTPPAGRNG